MLITLAVLYFSAAMNCVFGPAISSFSFNLIVHLARSRAAEIHTYNDVVVLLCYDDNTDTLGLFLLCRVRLNFTGDNMHFMSVNSLFTRRWFSLF